MCGMPQSPDGRSEGNVIQLIAASFASHVVIITGAVVATHLVMSFSQTMLHYQLGHRPRGRVFFRNHINFHHVHYSKDHLVSSSYLDDEGNNTPYFLLPVAFVIGAAYFVLPLYVLLPVLITCAASFYAHVFFDKEYHVEGSRLLRFGWFRHMQQLHFVHHRHANSNFAVIDFFWDRLLGTYRAPDVGSASSKVARPTARRRRTTSAYGE
jgi:hypothetical protein